MKLCVACGGALKEEPVFCLENAPASAQDIPAAGELGQDAGITLDLHGCPSCGLLQFVCDPVEYYRDVIRAGGYSTTMTQLRRNQYSHLIGTYHLEGKRFLEVGCGRGEFLSVLTEFPVKAYGIEHKEELVAAARAAGLSVWRGFPETRDRRLGEDGPYDVFLSFNFLEHQPHPDVMLQAIYNNLVEDGMGLVTVPALEYILEQGSYYELIRDHLAYHTFDSLQALLEQNGFLVLERELVNRDTISMTVKKNKDWKPGVWNKTSVLPADLTSVKAGYDTVQQEIDELLDTLKAEGKRLALWGASHQGFTLASTTRLNKGADYMIDSAPFKQGKFAPASHLPIVAPDYFQENPVDVILIVAPGYSEEIAGVIRTRFGGQVRVLTMRTSHLEPC